MAKKLARQAGTKPVAPTRSVDAVFAKSGMKTIADAVDLYAACRPLALENTKLKTDLEESFKAWGGTFFESATHVLTRSEGSSSRLSIDKIKAKFGADALNDCFETCIVNKWAIVPRI